MIGDDVGTLPECLPSCAEVDLTKADLKGADLTDVDLTGAILVKADLTRAVLSRSVLVGRGPARRQSETRRRLGEHGAATREPDGRKSCEART